MFYQIKVSKLHAMRRIYCVDIFRDVQGNNMLTDVAVAISMTHHHHNCNAKSYSNCEARAKRLPVAGSNYHSTMLLLLICTLSGPVSGTARLRIWQQYSAGLVESY